MPRHICVIMSMAKSGSNVRNHATTAVHPEGRDGHVGRASAAVNDSTFLHVSIPWYTDLHSCVSCCSRHHRAPRLSAETSGMNQPEMQVVRPAVCWADMMLSQNIAQARHSVYSPIIVARNGLQDTAGQSPNAAFSRPSPTARGQSPSESDQARGGA